MTRGEVSYIFRDWEKEIGAVAGRMKCRLALCIRSGCSGQRTPMTQMWRHRAACLSATVIGGSEREKVSELLELHKTFKKNLRKL